MERLRIGGIFNLQAGKNIATGSISEEKTKEKKYECFGGNGCRGYVSEFNREGKFPIIGRQGALCGCINYALGKIYATEHAVVVDCFDVCNERWATYFLKALNLNQYATSVAQPGIAVDKINKVLIPLPPLREQIRIVDKVDEIFKLLDTIDELQSFYTSDLEFLKRKLIDAGIQGKLTEQLSEDGTAEDLYVNIQAKKQKLIKEGKIKKEKSLPEISEEEIPFEIPENWKWVRLGAICSKISSGSTPAGGKKSNAYVKEGYCFFREQNVYNDGIHEEGLVYISEELLNARNNSIVLPMDILLNITGGSIGRCALIPEDFTKGSINQHILIIRLVNPRIRFYLHYCLCSPYVQKFIKGNSVGDKEGFSGGRCKNMLIPLPPLDEQVRIVNRLDKLLASM